jgi:hypothetical protein
MNNFYFHKFLSILLIITVLFLYSHEAEAKGVVNVFTSIVEVVAKVVTTVFNVISNISLSIIEMGLGGLLGNGFLSNDGKCRWGNLGNSLFKIYAGECDDSSASSWQGTPGSPTLNSQTAAPISQNNCITGFTLSYSVTDAYQYGIYRNNNLITQATLSEAIQPSPFNSQFSYNDTGLVPSTDYIYELSLTNKDGQQFRYPTMTVRTECSPSLTFQVSSEVKIPDPIYVGWQSENTNSCLASQDWSGTKPTSGSEYLTKPRGTYTFTLACSGPGGSIEKTGTASVIQVPRCSFTANPTSIILPASSTLSWSCEYADSCSIDQGVGSVNKISGTKDVRPSVSTTYTLTCQGLDGSRSSQATVNIGFEPTRREVPPY